MGTSTPCATTPMALRIAAVLGSLDVDIDSQHCTGAVSHCAKAAVAAARMEKRASLENMVCKIAELGLKACLASDVESWNRGFIRGLSVPGNHCVAERSLRDSEEVTGTSWDFAT